MPMWNPWCGWKKFVRAVFHVGEYKEYPHTEVRKLTSDEIKQPDNTKV